MVQCHGEKIFSRRVALPSALLGLLASLDVASALNTPLKPSQARRTPASTHLHDVNGQSPVLSDAFSPDKHANGQSAHLASASTATASATRTTRSMTASGGSVDRPRRMPPPLSDHEKLLEEMMKDGGYDRGRLVRFFASRPGQCATRAADFFGAYQRLKAVWEADQAVPPEQRQRGKILRQELAALGPVAVKLGQTLSQRPDIISEEVCEALKPLQTSNTPFDNDEALRIMATELEHDGPIAPGVCPPDCDDPDAPPLFAAISDGPIASASLGQVYRVRSHEGVDMAVKVQRPGAVRQVTLDFAVIASALWAVQRSGWGNGDLLEIIDIVAAGVFEELDYRNEARNAETFARSLQFLGYVAVPQPVQGYRLSRRLILTEWVKGRHLEDLSREEGLALTQMAVEAVTASLVLTGYVHADPHEGNLMLGDDGSLFFLDFGLMSSVQPVIMEAFASGIMAVLNKDYAGLVRAFMATGFVGSPIEYRANTKAPYTAGDPDLMAKELRERMESVPGGTSRFGALSTVLFDMGHNWKMYTPPYIILLIRTFLTLEGIAAKVDETFNIYEVSLPWAIQRALSPETKEGAAALRATFLTPQNKLQWERVQELVDAAAASGASDAASSGGDNGASSVGSVAGSGGASGGAQPSVAVKASATSGGTDALKALSTLLGSPQGATLRRIAVDLDSTELLMRLATPEASQLRRLSADALATAMYSAIVAVPGRLRGVLRGEPLRPKRGLGSASAKFSLTTSKSESLRRRRKARLATVGRFLILTHGLRQVGAGWRGAAAVAALVAVGVRIVLGALAKVAFRTGVATSAAVTTCCYVAMRTLGAPIAASRAAAAALALTATLWHAMGKPGSRALSART
mmetsp:Transcript_30244/g.66323  ORF Transcript_30244/g.66323 Transcript_30244/m.66323 type:complete len:865 (-) Transcript_30244:961-3555(-)